MYRIVRFYESAPIRRRIIAKGLTLEQAKAHTKRLGRWFDGFEEAR